MSRRRPLPSQKKPSKKQFLNRPHSRQGGRVRAATPPVSTRGHRCGRNLCCCHGVSVSAAADPTANSRDSTQREGGPLCGGALPSSSRSSFGSLARAVAEEGTSPLRPAHPPLGGGWGSAGGGKIPGLAVQGEASVPLRSRAAGGGLGRVPATREGDFRHDRWRA